MRPSIWRVIRELAGLFLPFLVPRPTYWVGQPMPQRPLTERSCHLIFKTIESDLLNHLLTLCRAEKTTLQGLFMSVMSHSIAKLATKTSTQSSSSSSTVRPEINVLIETAFDMRSQLPPQFSKTFGVYLCGSKYQHSVNLNNPFHTWEVAREMKASISTGVPYAIETIGLMSFITPPRIRLIEGLVNRVPNGRSSSLNISNLGTIANRSNTVWQPSCLRFAQSKRGEGPVIYLSIVTIASSNTLSLTFSFLELAVDKDQGEWLVKDVLARLKQLQ